MGVVAEQSKASYLVNSSALMVLACTTIIIIKAPHLVPVKEVHCKILAAEFITVFKGAQVLFKARGLQLKV